MLACEPTATKKKGALIHLATPNMIRACTIIQMMPMAKVPDAERLLLIHLHTYGSYQNIDKYRSPF